MNINFLEHRLSLAASVLMLSACGGGGGSVSVPTNQSPVANVVASKTTAFAGEVVTLNPGASADADGSIASFVWSFSDGSASITTSTAAVQSKSWATAGAQTVTLTVTDNQGATNHYAMVITVAAQGLLTDSGITASQCYEAGSDWLVSCTSVTALALNDQQDGMLGRDVTTPDNADGKLGLSYSTVPNPAGGNFDVTECVKDNITGLTWEGKTATGTRAGSNAYTNYDDPTAAQFEDGFTYVNPTQAQIDAATNAVGYKNAVNVSALCGYTDWRLPTVDELHSLVDYGVAGGPQPAIDTTWFPNTPAYSYRSATPLIGNAARAWIVVNGTVRDFNRYAALHVRLVR